MKRRKNSLRVGSYNYSCSGAYFITICSYKREEIFGEIKNGLICLNDFVIMPNHIHGIIWIVGAIYESPKDNPLQNNGVILELPLRIERRKMLLSKIIGKFKMNSSKLINDIRNSKGSHVWQRSYYDHIIRNEKNLNNIKQYIQNNPLNWGTDKNNYLE